jgi:hypothetical protein
MQVDSLLLLEWLRRKFAARLQCEGGCSLPGELHDQIQKPSDLIQMGLNHQEFW